MPVWSWLPAQAVRSFVKFLSLCWPRWLQTEDLWISSSEKKIWGAYRDWHLTSCATDFQQLAPAQCSSRVPQGEKFFKMLACVCLCLGIRETAGLICFDSAFSQVKIYPDNLPSSHSRTLLVCFPPLTTGSFCGFCMCDEGVCWLPVVQFLFLDSLGQVRVLFEFTGESLWEPSLKPKEQLGYSRVRLLTCTALFYLLFRMALWGGSCC